MRNVLYILLCVAWLLVSCQGNDVIPEEPAMGRLELSLSKNGRPVLRTRSIDSDLTIVITNDKNSSTTYQGSTMAELLELPAGNYSIKAFTDNQESWINANNGKGEGCYYIESSFEVKEDQTTRIDLNVPMTNYAVTLTLPELFYDLFSSYTFTVKSGTRSINIEEGEKAYFKANLGFSYRLEAMNIDNVTHNHTFYPVDDVVGGKLYNIQYIYDTDASSGGIDIVITDDMEDHDQDVPL